MTTCGIRVQAGKGSLMRRLVPGPGKPWWRTCPPTLGEKGETHLDCVQGRETWLGDPLARVSISHGYWGLWP